MWLIIGILILIFLTIFGSIKAEQNKKKQSIEESSKRKEKLKQEAIAKYKRLAKKYNPEIALKLVNGEYFIGMTKEQLLDSKEREPYSVQIQQLKTKPKKR